MGGLLLKLQVFAAQAIALLAEPAIFLKILAESHLK